MLIAGDLGSGLVVFFSGAIIIMMSGPRREWVLSTIAILIGLVALLLAADSLVDSIVGRDVLLKAYQMNRLLVFLDPTADTTGAGYNLMQSLIAVGSGGFFGKGIGNAGHNALVWQAIPTLFLPLRPKSSDLSETCCCSLCLPF